MPNDLLARLDCAYIFAGVFPRLNMARWSFCDERADRAINVITFKMDFRPSGFDRSVSGALKEQIRSKLNIAGVVSLTVIFQRGPRGEVVLDFEGPAEDVAKAKAAFSKR